MRAPEDMYETYVLQPGQTLDDLPEHFRTMIMPNSDLEKTVYVLKDRAGIARFHVVQLHNIEGK